MPAAAPTGGSTYNRKSRRAWQAKKKAIAKSDNPEGLKEQPDNSLFGKKRRHQSEGADEAEPATKGQKTAQRARAPVLKTDPAVQLAANRKKSEKAAKKSPSGGKHPFKAGAGAGSAYADKATKKKGEVADSKAHSRPHKEAVKASLHAWERLRAEKTSPKEREELIDGVLDSFKDSMVQVLQKHDAARVLQSCYRLGTQAQRDELMKRVKGQVAPLSLSHYGHFFVMCVVRHGTMAHKQALMAELNGHVAELVAHAEGSAVLQLIYTSVASIPQRNAFYRELWGKEFALLRQVEHSDLAKLFEADPACKPRVLRRLENLLSKAARKGLGMTTIVQRGLADLLQHADSAQQALLATTLKEAAPHVMHTRDGARIASNCVRHADAKDKKAILKAVKGYVVKAACDPNAALVLCTALEVVDDTVLLRKLLLSELLSELPTLCVDAHGSLPLLSVLAPRDKRYFDAAQLSVMGKQGDGNSKKDADTRRAELLQVLLPPLCRLCEMSGARLARSPHGGSVLYECLKAASDGVADVDKALRALATVALKPAGAEAGEEEQAAGEKEEEEKGEVEEEAEEEEEEGEGEDEDEDEEMEEAADEEEGVEEAKAETKSGEGAAAPASATINKAKQSKSGLEAYAHLPLVTHPYAARVLKKLVQEHPLFSEELLEQMSGSLKQWACDGAGWLVLALLESERSGATAMAELAGDAAAIRQSGAVGCRSLADALEARSAEAVAATPSKPKRARK